MTSTHAEDVSIGLIAESTDSRTITVTAKTGNYVNLLIPRNSLYYA